MLASPLTPVDRLPRLAGRARGFVYGVNLLGVTGERAAVGDMAAEPGGPAQGRDRRAGGHGLRRVHAGPGGGGRRPTPTAWWWAPP